MNKLVILTVTALILTACNTTNTSNPPAPNPLEQDFIMKGTLDPVEGTIFEDGVTRYFLQVAPYNKMNTIFITAGTIKEGDWTMEATLPAKVAQYMSRPLKEVIESSSLDIDGRTCQNDLRISNDIKGVLIQNGMIKTKGGNGDISYRYHGIQSNNDKKAQTISHFLYANTSGTIRGKLSCNYPNRTSILEFKKDIELKPGWNELKLTHRTPNGNNQFVQYIIDSIPNNIHQWGK